ncbi:TetR/AcrR family transcriptional regulator [Sphingomonas sp. BIUV-7]|uniref:TetR/AcrR family transcriptional regulator n=1 Tax=Sphingomonas natans TaxID=3063330 RepID=A0ABT8YCF7_9SPHN|nr:TetR/AcrR family transcriptional regulator [Sphingomonas sp. BIUV-7]MDO6415320.1 TetR/AcrR family transcriptional regulator [Sphingomonas sp. BIUV-7]
MDQRPECAPSLDSAPRQAIARRTREAKRNDKRDAIIAIARRMFLERGYAATSMSAIAAELGGSKGTLWAHFASKDALFAAVVTAAAEDFRSHLIALFQPCGDLEATLLSFARAFTRTLVAPSVLGLHRIVVSESIRHPEIGAIFYENAPFATQTTLARFLEQQVKAGRLEIDDPWAAGRAFLRLCIGPQQQALWGRPVLQSTELDREAGFAVETFLKAFGTASR